MFLERPGCSPSLRLNVSVCIMTLRDLPSRGIRTRWLLSLEGLRNRWKITTEKRTKFEVSDQLNSVCCTGWIDEGFFFLMSCSDDVHSRSAQPRNLRGIRTPQHDHSFSRYICPVTNVVEQPTLRCQRPECRQCANAAEKHHRAEQQRCIARARLLNFPWPRRLSSKRRRVGRKSSVECAPKRCTRRWKANVTCHG